MPRILILRYVLPAFLLVLFWTLHPNFTHFSNNPDARPLGNGHNERIRNDMDWVRGLLRNNSIGPNITFASRRLQYVFDAPERLQNTEVKQPLFPQSFKNISIKEENFLPSGDVLKIHVKRSPRPSQIDASKMLFAASTTPERFNDKRFSPVKEWVRWLTDGQGKSNGARMVLALFKSNSTQISATQDTLASLGINATVVRANRDLDMPRRYLDLVRLMWEDPSRPQKDYFAIVDDDTFFPAISSLLTTLKTYNPHKPYYIGTFTERADWLAKHQIPMAYGGAGIFLTAPTISQILAAECLSSHANGTSKIEATEGDRLLYHCINLNTDIALTRLPRLFQFDMFGDPSGFYESGHQPLSIHHYKTWHRFSPHLAHTVASACGEDCVFQKFQFSDNFVLANGYSVAEYPKGITFDQAQYENTFNYKGVPAKEEAVVHAQTFGMMRKSLTKTGKKRQWLLLGSREEGGGRVRQVYVKRRRDERWIRKGVEKLPQRDSVVVLSWVP